MRTRHLVTLTVLLPLAFLFFHRQHVRDVAEVVRTYARFHAYVQRHEDVLFRYPGTASGNDDDDNAQTLTQASRSGGQEVPKIIHQIFLTDGKSGSSLAKYEPAIRSCERLHPGWKLHVWSDEEAREFMAEFYPKIYPHFLVYKQNIQRANILRYALLHHFGGVYLDLDVTCLAPLDAPLSYSSGEGVWRLTDLPLLTPGAYPAGVNNAFILARPGHPYLGNLLEKAPSRDISWPMPYVENMLSTGCMFFSNVWMSYVLQMARTSEAQRHTFNDNVYILADEGGNAESHMLRGKVTTPLFAHGGASSWHGWDAAAIVLIGKHYGYFATGLAFIVVLCAFGGWKLTSWTRRRKISSWRLIPSEAKSLRLSSPV